MSIAVSMPGTILAIILFSSSLLCAQQETSDANVPSWIWLGKVEEHKEIKLRRSFNLEQPFKLARLAATCDNACEVYLNGERVLSSNNWEQLEAVDVSKFVVPGRNSIAVAATNEGGIAGFLAVLSWIDSTGKRVDLVSDETWKATSSPSDGWKARDFDDAKWQASRAIGKLGDRTLPWTTQVNARQLTEALESGSATAFKPKLADHAKVPAGFKIEQIFDVPRSMGSWVSLCVDNRGRLIASDQGNAGLFMITLGSGGTETQVEKLPVKLSGAQGLLWAFDSLYAVVNGGPTSGLHRLRDTDGNGQVDSDEHLMYVPGGGEHGPHGVVLSPDGKSLFVISGNHTKLPNSIAGSRLPQNWNEDHLLPRRWDANGHAAGILAPGGWICNVDPDGKQWNVWSIGYRNAYDIAFSADGELFTFDSDMEWDFGSPWYRPTRVCHATSGSEFGWRSGTGKWPVYYEDSLPPAINIGPGSPTGVLFGTGAKFPAKYQKTLYVLDWTYSTIYGIQMQPNGSSYKGIKEDFVTGSPLPVTDAIIGSDGAMYFTVGGRGAQSAMYRVSYVGSESTVAVSGRDSQGAELRHLRKSLEASHGTGGGDLELIWGNLGHSDRFIRYAARVALEFLPVASWRERAMRERNEKILLNAVIAWAHQGKPEDLPSLLKTLQGMSFSTLAESDQLTFLRALQLAFTRLGQPSEVARKQWLDRLEPLFPSKSDHWNAELVQLLVYLGSPTVVSKALALMDSLGPEPIPDWGYLVERNVDYGGTVAKMLADMPPVRAIHYAFVLRNAKSGWTLEQRRKYFEFFVKAAKHPGGNSFARFLMQFREDALLTCSPAERIAVEKIAGQSLLGTPVAANPPIGPGRKWTTPEVVDLVQKDPLRRRNYTSARNLYHATACAKCHRLNGEGGAVGPDLSTAGKKFPLPDLVDAILEPSKVISDQYGSHQVLTNTGKVIVGRAVEIEGQLHIFTADADAQPIILKRGEIDAMNPSKVSQMPVGLVDALNAEELKDLVAYLLSSGNERDPMFSR